jgi:hypothetical protein
MSFKLLWIAFFSVVFLATGCGVHIGGKAPDQAEMAVSGNKYTCVSKMAQKFNEFIEDKTDDEEINKFVNCLQSSFLMFASKFRGEKERNVFSPEEIRYFIESNFLPKDRHISDELLRQFMVIKQNLVGGKINQIKREDLAAAVRILEEIRVEALRLRPFVAVLNPKLLEHQDPVLVGSRLEEADEALRTSVGVIGRILASSQSSYDFSDFKTFLIEFRKFVDWDEYSAKTRSPDNWVELLASFKAITMSSDPNALKTISKKEWIPFLETGSQWFLAFLRFNIGIKNETLLEGNGFTNFVAWGDEVQRLLNLAVERQPGRIIPFTQLDRFVFALKSVDWLPKRIEASSLNKALHATISKILGPEDFASNARSSPGLTKLTIGNLFIEFTQWQEVQLALIEKFNQVEQRSERFKIYSNNIPLLNMPLQIAKLPLERASWERFISSFQDKRPLFKEDRERLFLVEEARLAEYKVTNGFYNLSKMNILRAVLGLIYKGYSPTENGANGFRLKGVPMNAGLPQEALQTFYKDFREMGIDLGILDSRVPNAGARTFMEAKIFTYLGNGLDANHPLLSYAQAIEEGAFLFSGGEMSRDLYKRFHTYCKEIGEDQNKVATLERSCVQAHLVPELLALITTMPYYTKFLEGLNLAQADDYAETLLKTARSKGNEVELSQLATISVVIHYAEAVFTKYNVQLDDHMELDDRLSEEEVDASLPVFSGLIYKLAKEKKGIDLDSPLKIKHVFKFILAKGRLPRTIQEDTDNADYKEIRWHIGAEWASWTHFNLASGWNLSIDRMQIAKVFAVIIQSIVATAPSQVEPLIKVEPDCAARDNQSVPADMISGAFQTYGPNCH